LGHLEMDVVAAEHRLGLLRPATFCVQAARDSLLAVTQDFGIGSVHSKCHFSLGLVSLSTSQQTEEGRGEREIPGGLPAATDLNGGGRLDS
jgi:hypothetical protein